MEGTDRHPQTRCRFVCKRIIYQHGSQTVLELEDPIGSFVRIWLFDIALENLVARFVLLPKFSDGRIKSHHKLLGGKHNQLGPILLLGSGPVAARLWRSLPHQCNETWCIRATQYLYDGTSSDHTQLVLLTDKLTTRSTGGYFLYFLFHNDSDSGCLCTSETSVICNLPSSRSQLHNDRL